VTRDPHFNYFDEFTPGATTESGAYEVSEEEILEFAGKYDPQFFHMDPEAAKKTHFGGLIASGWHTCAIMMRLVVLDIAGGKSGIGSPGIDQIRWLRPVRPGDKIRVKVTVADLRASRSRPERGTVSFDYQVLNQKDETVMTMKGLAMFPRELSEEQ